MRVKFFPRTKVIRISGIEFSKFLISVSLLFFVNLEAISTVPNSSLNSYLSSLKIHAFHTSITQIDYNSKAKTYEISLRLFSDDFAKAIDTENKTRNTKIEDGDKTDAVVSAYVLKHFLIISPQNKKANLKYIGKENEDLATWVYLEIPAESLTTGSKIQQNCLMELFDDQVNILNYRKGEERKTLIFDTKNKVKVWE
jgi:hypothetical protein